ncbi:30S ribosomal protein S1 [Terribacillus saccharophilus]|uniref:30S ribosomal protein S1 n=1 Tax=Terribacillus saccharophilus TaxID=361277 RepID=A0A075LJY0_9BACI|nr:MULTISPECIES: 30S ribosomal protein S1 [Terribacillus]AIF66664.1 30S ribosomal protein S1 [Terribacillus goriensis]MCM3224632.1 30S ribosomal protein S1 [Terribacillus saccharophilus]MEC0283472.1 30S ribosomal protein S1 [Terribacillus saccharophilus]MEC0290428.1 30S ribosomal protein S1 [Terribacillus saccharophilus]SEM62021.1 SSU ribosomal protein S1P [Terribacillus saccharophilus]
MDEMNEQATDFKELSVGDTVTGKVVKVEDKQALVDIGYKVEGILPISELSSLHVERAADAVSEGEELTLKVKKVDDEEVVLSKRAVTAELAWDDLEAKFESGEIFEAEVKEVVKGGLVVDVGLRGFIPASLVETYFVEEFEGYKGKPLTLKVVELDREQNRVILSHRAVAEEEEASKKQEVLDSLEAGQVIDGTVQRLTDFGVFVSIGGGIDGLVHISQLSHEHVEKASDVVTEGQEIKVKVLGVDKENERISLSLKETLPGPWENISDRAQAGDVLEGEVKRLVSFGAFVEVFPGVEGLVHISQIANRHIGTPQEVLEPGQTVQVKVLEVNESEKRMSLSIKELEQDENDAVIKEYEKEEEHSGFQLGDILGDKLNKYKQ